VIPHEIREARAMFDILLQVVGIVIVWEAAKSVWRDGGQAPPRNRRGA